MPVTHHMFIVLRYWLGQFITRPPFSAICGTWILLIFRGAVHIADPTFLPVSLGDHLFTITYARPVQHPVLWNLMASGHVNVSSSPEPPRSYIICCASSVMLHVTPCFPVGELVNP